MPPLRRRRLASARGGAELKPSRPNVGTTVAYRKALTDEIAKMEADVTRTLRLVWRDDPPLIAAADMSPAAAASAALAALRRRWETRFATMADVQGPKFTKAAFGHTDRSMRAMLKRAGFTVEFKISNTVRDVFLATVQEQVNLIKSIPSGCLTNIASIVAAGIQSGHDLHFISKSLQHEFGVTRKRADLIARDQSNKATATITRARQQELGITHARWLHSSAGRYPRAEHVAFSKGTHRGENHGPVYEIAKGAFLEGKRVWPGTEINCRCVSISIIPGLESGGPWQSQNPKTSTS